MSRLYAHSKLLIVAVCCIALGAGAGAVASATASTAGSGHTAAARRTAGELRRLAARAVQGTAVVHTTAGYQTVTWNRGRVESVSGDQLTIAEGTRTAVYKTVTLTIAPTAKVRDDRQSASLSAVTPGQRVLVVVTPKRTLVIARTPRAS